MAKAVASTLVRTEEQDDDGSEEVGNLVIDLDSPLTSATGLSNGAPVNDNVESDQKALKMKIKRRKMTYETRNAVKHEVVAAADVDCDEGAEDADDVGENCSPKRRTAAARRPRRADGDSLSLSSASTCTKRSATSEENDDDTPLRSLTNSTAFKQDESNSISSTGLEQRRDANTWVRTIGTTVEEELLGPCEPGRSLILDAICWHEETKNGLLVVGVSWRGKTYAGTLLDCTKYHWAPPSQLSLTKGSTVTTMAKNGVRGVGVKKAAAAARRNGAASGLVPLPPVFTETPTSTKPTTPVRCSSSATKEEELVVSCTNETLLTLNETLLSSGDRPLIGCTRNGCSKKFANETALTFHLSAEHRTPTPTKKTPKKAPPPTAVDEEGKLTAEQAASLERLFDVVVADASKRSGRPAAYSDISDDECEEEEEEQQRSSSGAEKIIAEAVHVNGVVEEAGSSIGLSVKCETTALLNGDLCSPKSAPAMIAQTSPQSSSALDSSKAAVSNGGGNGSGSGGAVRCSSSSTSSSTAVQPKTPAYLPPQLYSPVHAMGASGGGFPMSLLADQFRQQQLQHANAVASLFHGGGSFNPAAAAMFGLNPFAAGALPPSIGPRGASFDHLQAMQASFSAASAQPQSRQSPASLPLRPASVATSTSAAQHKIHELSRTSLGTAADPSASGARNSMAPAVTNHVTGAAIGSLAPSK